MTVIKMVDAERSRNGQVLREYTKLNDSESNSATVLVTTRTLRSNFVTVIKVYLHVLIF